jgi:thioredoxin 1|tara:strand:- start:29 stop:331 length:303 start_codon:yes stop_codon:yes gene_type:complete
MEINDINFSDIVNTGETLLIKASANWCNPCKILQKNLDSIDLPIPLYHLDVDKNPLTANKLKVRGIPYMIIYKDKKMASNKVGVQTPRQLTEWIQAFVGA